MVEGKMLCEVKKQTKKEKKCQSVCKEKQNVTTSMQTYQSYGLPFSRNSFRLPTANSNKWTSLNRDVKET